MKFRTLSIIGIFYFQNAFAVLAPFYESLVEIKDMLADPRFADTFDTAESIQTIETIDTGFLIRTRTKEMKVDVIYKSISQPGRQQYDFRFNRPVQNPIK